VKTLDRDAQQDRFMGFFVRPMRADNIAQVEELERECFPTTWPPTPFLKELQNRIARYLVACEVRRPGRPTPEEVLPPTPITTQPEPSAIGRFLSGVKGLFTGGKLPPQDSTQSIAGYVGIWLIADEAHITAIGSRNSLRGKGVGELLLIATVELARAHGSNVVTLEVRASNRQALDLYQRLGYAVVDESQLFVLEL